MNDGGGGLSKSGTALIILFVIIVVAIITVFFYAWWRRRVFHRRASSVGGGDEVSRYSTSEYSTTSNAASKELLYLFCVSPQFSLDRNALSTPNSVAIDFNSNVDVELMKINNPGMLGPPPPPRFLFTISEEAERELGLESPMRLTLFPTPQQQQEEGAMSLKEYLEYSAEEKEEPVDVDDATPFSTPCASPVYFTPTASPVHDVRFTGEGASNFPNHQHG